MRSSTPKQALAKKDTDQGRSSIGLKKTDHGKYKFYSEGGNTMATKKPNPFAKFEKSSKDKEAKGVKEGSKKDKAMDAKQSKGFAFAKGGGVESRGKTKGKMC
jgi:hypothetical protein